MMKYEDDEDVLDPSRSTMNGTEEDGRDEVKEVQKMSQKDTNYVVFWRFVVTLMLLVTALVVTMTTYRFLLNEQTEDFETAVRNHLAMNVFLNSRYL